MLKQIGSIALRFLGGVIKETKKIEEQSKKASHRPLGPEWEEWIEGWDPWVERQVAIAEYKYAQGQRGPETWRK